jgi:Zn-dependent protease with chaperone function
MAQLDEFKKGLLKVLLFSLLSLFFLPVSALLFVEHAESARDIHYLSRVGQAIDNDAAMSNGEKTDQKLFFAAHPPSTVCQNDEPALTKYRANVCSPYSELWQYKWVEIISWWAIIGGIAVLLAIAALGAVAFVNRQAQYVSFVIGWNLLRLTSAAEVLVQGSLLIWLSFWLTAFFFERYFLKLVLIAALLAGGAAFLAIVSIFKRPPRNTGIDGEIVGKQDAPTLWSHLQDTATRVGTTPPDNLVAGIDTNFFVTESPLLVGNRTLKGRSLFVSLPLLRILERAEADAVLAHELAHFRGGDTASSAALGPKLVQFDHYCHLMRHGGATLLVFHVINLYRVIFEFALRRDSREREFLADRIAARAVSPPAIVSSLIKIAAYANYRSQVERELFAHGDRHGDQLGIAQQVSTGLVPYATSAHFVESMKTANVPHPFDSHPPLIERMNNVGIKVAEKDYGGVAARLPKSTWVNDIQSADAIEQRLWAEYEQRFTAQHEMSLAYRYKPDNDVERAIVVKHFPPVVFQMKKKKIEINYAGLVLPDQNETLSWDRVTNLKYTDGIGGDVLEIVHPEKGLIGAKTTKVKLPGISKQRDKIKATLGRYWQRHKMARQ